MSEVIRLGDRTYRDYMSYGDYNSYLNNKIYNEQRLASMLHSSGIISESAYGNLRVFTEAKIADKVKATWNKFIEFVKGVVDKFMETMTHLLLDEKAYLEKYKDIIINRKPKDDLEFSYNGNYDTAIDRLMNMEVPVFNYEQHASSLKKDGYEEILSKHLMNGKNGWTYDENSDKSLAQQFKDWYLDIDSGQKTGKFSDLNFRKMYDFCHDTGKIENIVKKDQQHLEQSTAAFEAAIQKEIRLNGDSAVADEEENPEVKKEQQTGIPVVQQDASESAMIEAEVGTDLKVTNTNTSAQSKMGSYVGDNAKKIASDSEEAQKAGKAAVEAGDTEEVVSNMMKKWIDVCQSIITAKLSACQTIAKDYMDIIRYHVRSYGGKDLKKDNSTKRTTTQSAGNYQKDSDKKTKEKETT